MAKNRKLNRVYPVGFGQDRPLKQTVGNNSESSAESEAQKNYWISEKERIELERKRAEDDKTDHLKFHLEFASKGIDPVKFLDINSSRYFNVVAILKTVLIEVVIISTQMLPLFQTAALFSIQLAFFIYYLLSLVKYRIFTNAVMHSASLFFETCLMFFLTVSFMQAWCEAGFAFGCTRVSLRRIFIFSVILGMILCLGFYVFLLI